MSAPAAAAAKPTSKFKSKSKRSCPAAATDSERRVQPRHSHNGTSAVAASAAGDGAAAVEADHSPHAAARLYRRALASIFAFLNQRELAVALQVSRGWLAAVKSMGSLRLTLRKATVPLREVAESAMGRHVSQLGTVDIGMPMTADALFIVARHMPQLHRLSCDMKLTPSQGRLSFPSGLQQLTLRVAGRPAAADANAALRTISRLPLLESLHTVDLVATDGQLSFAPLAALSQLRRLRIVDEAGGDDELSDAQVAQLRALPHLRRLDVDPMSTPLLSRLLAQPHDLQWQQIGLPDPLDDEAATLLPQLPSLTKIVTWCSGSHFEWLQELPNLAHVDMRIAHSDEQAVAVVASLMAALRHCAKIESLKLRCRGLRTAHLADLLPQLPRLTTLELGEADVDSLSFLAQPPLSRQLAMLHLFECKRLPIAELRHVHALKGLQSLNIHRSFTAPLDADSLRLLTPPSAVLPQLDKFEYSR